MNEKDYSICKDSAVSNGKTIPLIDLITYMNNVYNEIKGIVQNELFQCKDISEIFKDILTEQVDLGNLKNTPHLELENLDNETQKILIIQCPTMVANEHFLTAVLNNNDVNIYQAFGKNNNLFKKEMSYVEFIKKLKKLEEFAKNSNLTYFNDNFIEQLSLEMTLYGLKEEYYIFNIENARIPPYDIEGFKEIINDYKSTINFRIFIDKIKEDYFLMDYIYTNLNELKTKLKSKTGSLSFLKNKYNPVIFIRIISEVEFNKYILFKNIFIYS